jgi:FMN phosphatase YigB (HAD superfamily)
VEILDRLPIINEFYEKDFEGVKAVCGFDPKASEIVKAVRGMGLKTALATMPVFPRVATESRMRWAGLDAEDFELVTTLENSCFCKPNPNYYTDIAKRLGVSPEECLMVGNDTLDDMAAEEAGMKVFLLTDNIVNRENKDLSRYNRGGFRELCNYINEKMTV